MFVFISRFAILRPAPTVYPGFFPSVPYLGGTPDGEPRSGLGQVPGIDPGRIISLPCSESLNNQLLVRMIILINSDELMVQ